jgi:hypothetical protein
LVGSLIVLKILVIYVCPSRKMSGKNLEIRHTPFQNVIHDNLFTTRRDKILASKASFNKTQMQNIIFLFNNQPDALFIQIYSAVKLYMFRAMSLSIIRSLLLYIWHWSGSCRMELMSSILTLLGNGHHNLLETDQCRMYSRRLLKMDKEVARNMYSFMTE